MLLSKNHQNTIEITCFVLCSSFNFLTFLCVFVISLSHYSDEIQNYVKESFIKKKKRRKRNKKKRMKEDNKKAVLNSRRF